MQNASLYASARITNCLLQHHLTCLVDRKPQLVAHARKSPSCSSGLAGSEGIDYPRPQTRSVLQHT